jgi:excisionase family DNA binding protein
VKDAAECSGYSLQYIRRLLRLGKLAGLKLGQQWLIQMGSFEAYLANAESSKDHRFGPK